MVVTNNALGVTTVVTNNHFLFEFIDALRLDFLGTRLLDFGTNIPAGFVHRGFVTYEELGKSLGKRNSTTENVERAFIILVDEKITLVEKKSQYQSNKKKESCDIQ